MAKNVSIENSRFAKIGAMLPSRPDRPGGQEEARAC